MIRFFSRLHRYIYRLGRGRALGGMGNANFLLLTTTGRKTGRQRTVPLVYLRDGDRYVVIASYGGSPTDPAWLLNIRKNPRVFLQTGSRRESGIAQIAAVDERERLWPAFVEAFQGYEKYQARTNRRIPIVIIKPWPV